MQAADDARFPRFDSPTTRLFRDAEIESIDTYEDNLEKYEKQNFTFIPIPDVDKYYDLQSKSLEDIHEDQYVAGSVGLREVFELLGEHEFLLKDTWVGSLDQVEVYYVSDEEYYFLSEDAPDHAEIKELPDLQADHPEILEDLKWGSRYQFIDLADLNRREVREALYPVVAELESVVAEALREDVDDPKDMYHTAPDHVVGRREKDILNNIELHTAEYLTLGNMIGLLKGRKHLWDQFGFESPNEVGDRLGSIHDLRNRVMHSNRTLIRSQKDVSKTLERVNDAQRIISQVRDFPTRNLEYMWDTSTE